MPVVDKYVLYPKNNTKNSDHLSLEPLNSKSVMN